MPLRDFICEAGHELEMLVRHDEADPKRCKRPVGESAAELHSCGAKLARKLTAPASRFPKADSWRR